MPKYEVEAQLVVEVECENEDQAIESVVDDVSLIHGALVKNAVAKEIK